MRVREHAEEIAFYRGEKGEMAGVKGLLEKVRCGGTQRERGPEGGGWGGGDVPCVISRVSLDLPRQAWLAESFRPSL